ncbi:ABC transporter related (plasmid) [Rhizobium leguminosarum bv. trifolii WSM2304]|uniref:ABC transporter related n=1 Tax=Rhizobium leguminosarum bv. trifolii (strain WSM2304) TaxID=395492 RepID=A0ABF7QYR7_RHILW|nr:ABC transporter ATP-binding protein [Rhizobium leguminosarum]ACI59484.1 ABC transporter related [Rhizobium leguminosarum bv. trifolii WSM2304]
MSSIRIANLYKNYSALPVLKDINLEIETGQFVVFVGPSGCGKSTLLRCISGLEGVSAGTLAIDGKMVNDVAPAERGIAMVFQSYALYPHMTVAKNIAYPLRIAGVSKAEQHRRVEDIASKLKLTDYLHRLPKALSGGQRQRVAIGRAIIRDPNIFLFDEPLSNLDAALRVQMRLELTTLKSQLPNTTMIYVTHDQVEAMTMADKIVVLRAGVIEQVGTPMDLYDWPQSEFVAGFIGSPKMNFLTKSHANPFQAARIGIRPEHLTPQDGGPWSGRVTHVEHLGSDTFVYLDLSGDESLTVRLDGRSPIAAGDNLTVGPKGPVYRFSPEGRTMAA